MNLTTTTVFETYNSWFTRIKVKYALVFTDIILVDFSSLGVPWYVILLYYFYNQLKNRASESFQFHTRKLVGT